MLSWDRLRLTRIGLAERVDCSTGDAQMEEVGDGEAVEDADATNMGVDGLVSGVRGEPWIWSQHSSQTFARLTGDVGLSKAEIGT